MNPTVLYIAGWSRSGSTLLDQVLGQQEDSWSCGELRLLWNDLTCGCRAPVLECEFWGALLPDVLQRHGLTLPEARTLRSSLSGTDPRLLLARSKRSSDLRRYAELITDLYLTISSQTRSSLLIDSSKAAL